MLKIPGRNKKRVKALQTKKVENPLKKKIMKHYNKLKKKKSEKMILLWCILGAIAGILAGLIPGLHSNNVAILILASPIFGIEITAFMLSMCIVQSFIDFIPATFLGAPTENTFESILPAHRLLLKGKAIEGICCTVLGGLIAVIAGTILTPVFFLYIEQNSKQIIQATPIVLIAALIIFITTEQTLKKKLTALFVIIAAASQGMLFHNQIFPLITGYFGVAGTLYSIKEKPLYVKQKETANIKPKTALEALIGLAGGALVAVMPGIGTNTAAGMINIFRRTSSTKKYLTMLGAINCSNFFFSYATLIALQKARNGTMIALQDKIFYTENMLLLGTIIMLFSAGIGGLAAIILAKKTAKIFTEKNTFYFSIGSIALMIGLVAILNGVLGVITLFFATALGLFVLTQGIRRSTCMCSLIVPALMFYLFILF
jgi:putative membrane protein